MPAPPPTDRHLPAADGIRGLACLIVLVSHGISFFWPASFPYLKGSGKYAVWLFFVLSAFLLAQGLQRRGLNKASLRDYAISRSLRILPMFVVACVIYYVAGVGITSQEQLWAVLSLEQGTIHLWTIAVEFKFYLLLPFILWAALQLQGRYGNSALLVGAAVLVLGQQYLWPYWLTPENSPLTLWYLPTFIFGVLAGLLQPQLRAHPVKHLASAFALLTLALLIIAIPGVRAWLFGPPLDTNLADKHLYLGLLWALFIALLVDGQSLAGRLLSSRPLTFLGTVSYSTYLIHWLIMVYFAKHWPQQPLALAAAISLSIAIGTAGHHWGELPLERLRKKLNPSSRMTGTQEIGTRSG